MLSDEYRNSILLVYIIMNGCLSKTRLLETRQISDPVPEQRSKSVAMLRKEQSKDAGRTQIGKWNIRSTGMEGTNRGQQSVKSTAIMDRRKQSFCMCYQPQSDDFVVTTSKTQEVQDMNIPSLFRDVLKVM